MTKRRLGRGLGALLGYSESGEPEEIPVGDLCHIPVREIDPNPYQPREDFDPQEMAALVQSISQHGIVQPIVVRPVGARFQLIAGERRLRAALEAGLEEMPARVLDIDDRKIFEVALVENLQRQDLNPLEKARAFQEYLKRFEVTQEELAGHLGLDRSTIANLIRLLELPEEVQAALRAGRLTAGHARALLPLGEEAEQVAMAHRIEKEQLSVRAVEAIVSQTVRFDEEHESAGPHASSAKGGPGAATRPLRYAHIQSLEDQLRQSLGTRVEIKLRGKDRGRIIVHFTSNEEFERLLSQLTPRASAMASAG